MCDGGVEFLTVVTEAVGAEYKISGDVNVVFGAIGRGGVV